MNWQFHRFESLTTAQLFQVMKLRIDVFVVEQQCPYPELDAHDNHPDTLHLLCVEGDTLAAYARAMPSLESSLADAKGVAKIGRVVVAPSHRGTGLAQALMQRIVDELDTSYPDYEQVLSAQEPITAFYQAFGFVAESEAYLEDGIPHVDMRRGLPSSATHS